MELAKTVEAFLLKHPQREKELNLLRNTLLETGLHEDLKWGMPAYIHKNKNIIGLGAFKSYVGLWFHQGVFLKDEANQLQNAQEGKTKAMRQWRFHSVDEIDIDLVKTYVFEAMANSEAGMEVKPTRDTGYDMPAILQGMLNENKDINTAFFELTPGRQKEYALYISEAKQESTQIRRINKIVPMILDGDGLNDKYK